MKSKYKYSTPTVVLIFLVLYIGELSLITGIVFKLIIPKFKDFKNQQIIKQLEDAKKEHPEKAELFSLYEKVSPNVYNNLEKIWKLIDDKKYDDAIIAVQALPINSQNDADKAFINLILVNAYSGKKDIENTKKYALELIKYGPNYSFGYPFLADIDLTEKNYGDALIQAKKAVELNPKQASYHYLLSFTLYVNHQNDEALIEIKKAVELDPSNEKYKAELKRQSYVPTTINNPIPGSTNYSQQDIDYWKSAVDTLNYSLGNMPKFINNPSYDQSKIQRLNYLINKMKPIADAIYSKMTQKLPLTTKDEENIGLYSDYLKEEQILAKELFQ